MRIRIDGKDVEFVEKEEAKRVAREAVNYARSQVREVPFLPIETANEYFEEWLGKQLE